MGDFLAELDRHEKAATGNGLSMFTWMIRRTCEELEPLPAEIMEAVTDIRREFIGNPDSPPGATSSVGIDSSKSLGH